MIHRVNPCRESPAFTHICRGLSTAGVLLALVALLVPLASAHESDIIVTTTAIGSEGFTGHPSPASSPDPVAPWLTFLGGGDWDAGEAIAIDAHGNLFVAGYSYSSWGEPLEGHHEDRDAFVARLSDRGTLMWHTFLGSAAYDNGCAVTVDGDGNVYVAGHSNATWGSPERDHEGGADAFVAKLDSDGNLIWNTFLGSSGWDVGKAIAVDGNGNVYVAGNSNATWGTPLTGREYQGGGDAFIARLDSTGELEWHAFLGGAGEDSCEAIAVDGDGNVYITGLSAADWGTPEQGHAGETDAFVAKLSDVGILDWHTFLGGTGGDRAYGIAVDVGGNVYVAGESWVTWGSPGRAHQGDGDAFAAKLDSSGGLTWNTFLGGPSADYGYAIDVDASGTIWLTGRSDATWGSPVRSYTSSADAFVARLDSSGDLMWSTFLGGAGWDEGRAIATSAAGSAYVAGLSYTAWEECCIRPYSDHFDAFVVHIHGDGSIQPDGIELDLKTGWNMVSVPLEAAGRTPAQVFGAAAMVYAWDAADGKYIEPSTIEPGKGYWVRSTSDHEHFTCGTRVEGVTFDVAEGWNLIGGPDASILVSELAAYDCLLLDHVHWWHSTDKEYVHLGLDKHLETSKAYWIASTEECTITLPAP